MTMESRFSDQTASLNTDHHTAFCRMNSSIICARPDTAISNEVLLEAPRSTSLPCSIRYRKTASRETPVGSLSGGNQQKVILARWLLTHPDYLILDEPTRGIDVGTKLEIQKLVLKLAEEGVSVTFISSEVEEMLRTCSRLIVMRDRHIVGELKGSDLNQTQVMKTIAGGEA